MNGQSGSWLALVAFCALTTLTAALGFGVLFVGGSVAFAVPQSSHVSDETQPDTVRLSQVSGDKAGEVGVSRPSQLRQVDRGGASGKTFTGMVTDARCGARHSMKSDKTSAECARSCVRKGARYVLVDGEETHALEGDPDQLDGLAGVRVEIVGKLVGGTIKVEAVAAR